MSEAEPKEEKRRPERTLLEPESEVKCKHCGATSYSDGRPFKTWSDVGIHVRTECTKYVPKPRKRRGPPPVEGEVEEPSEEEKPAIKAPPDIGDTPMEVLENVLKYYCELHPSTIKTVMYWAHLQGPLHPTTLAGILTQECGLKTAKANMIAQKYGLALNKMTQEQQQKPPLMFGQPPFTQPQQPTFMPYQQFPQPQQWYQPQQFGQMQPTWPYPPQQYPQYPPRPMDPNEIAEKAATKTMKEAESRFKEIEREIRSIREIQPQPYPQEQMVESYEPVRDVDGSIVRDANGEVVVKKTLTPVSIMKQKDPMTEVYRLLYEQSRKTEKGEGPPPLTEEKIREIVREATAKEPLSEEKVKDIIESVMEKQRPTTKDPDILRLEGELKEARKSVEEMKDKFTEKEKEYLQNQLNQVQTQLNSLQTSIMNIPSGEWKSDEIKALTLTMKEIGSILKEKKPVDTLLEKGPRVLRTLQPGIPVEPAPELTRQPVMPQPPPTQPTKPTPQAQPPPQPPEKVDEVTQALRRHGLSVRLE